MERDYVHGYSDRESVRLEDQASTLTELLHRDTLYPAGAKVLEVGCGVGAQTTILARGSPGARFTSVDISSESLERASTRTRAAGLGNVEFHFADAYDLPYEDGHFDHAFVCFVLEHLARPSRALAEVRRCIRPGGTLTVIEGDHGSAFFHPDSAGARRTIECLIELQARSGGNALIGRQLHPLLMEAGFTPVRVSPRIVYVDSSRPEWVEGFIRNTFTAMIEDVAQRAIAAGLMDEDAWRAGIEDLRRTMLPGGVFCYTFFKALALK